MRTISLHQPYAVLVMAGIKKHETRGWKTPYQPPPAGEWIGLHAALKPVRRDIDPDLAKVCWMHLGKGWREHLVFGAIVGKMFIDKVFVTEKVSTDAIDGICGNYEPGRQAWHIAQYEKCAPMPWRGQQKWFDVPDRYFEGN